MGWAFVKTFRQAHAAQQGHAPSQLGLALLYTHGVGLGRDEAQAVHWCRKAAKQQFEPAEFLLGLMYEFGIGVGKDPEQAFHWYQKAADRGYAEAQNNLAGLYEVGLGVRQNLEEALKWYKRAAEQGQGDSYMNLARLYSGAYGAKPDDGLAYFWAVLAQRSLWPVSSRPSEQMMQQMRSRVSPEQAASVDSKIEAWMRNHPASPPPTTFDLNWNFGQLRTNASK
jgi:TPR repeat protein